MNKGTLTILSDTNAILGLPTEPPYPESTIMRCRDAVTVWLKDGGVLTLPFPVEIIDMRNYGNKTVVVHDIYIPIAPNNPDTTNAITYAIGQRLRSQMDMGVEND